MPSAALSCIKYLHDHVIAPRILKYVAPPFIIHLHIFGELFGSNTWLVKRTVNILLRTKDPSLDIVIINFGTCIPWTTFSLEMSLVCVSFDLAVPSTSIPLGNISRPSQEVSDNVAAEVLSQKGHGKPVDLWSIGCSYSLPYQSFILRWNADYALQKHHLRPPSAYTPFRADEMAVIQQAMEVRSNPHNSWENVTDEGTHGIVAACGNVLI